MRTIVLFASVTMAAGLLLVNMYTSIVDATSWGSDIPHSIATAREYFKTVNPGHFFRLFSPVNQLLGLLALIVCWKSAPDTRPFLATALVMYLVAEGLTFQYFYPRNAVMFTTASLSDVELLKKTWAEWNAMNWVRSFVLVVGIVCSFWAVHLFYGRVVK